MASEMFFQACQEGDVEKLIEQIESQDDLDISGKDGYGMTALAYAARNGHAEVVRQLLSRGADRTEVLEQGYGKSNPEIAQMLDDGAEAQGPQTGGQEEAEVGGMHQGMSYKQMGEGNYMNGTAYPPQGYPMMPGYAPQGQQYYYDGMQGNGPPQTGSGRRSSQQQGHMRKDSSVNLPPPEIARLIPCRFFPNCKYGDKCMFAHPVMAMPGGPQGSNPLSPSMSQPPMQPICYQQVPSGYPYPGPYGAGPQQPFYAPMGAPNPMQHQQQYGLPSHMPHSMIQSHPQQHMQMTPPNKQTLPVDATPINDSDSQSRPAAGGEQQNAQVDVTSPSSSHPPLETANGVPQEEKPVASSSLPAIEQANLAQEQGRDATATPPQQDVAAPLGSQEMSDDKAALGEGEQGSQDTRAGQDAQGKPAHRRQSFNSFLHHHAIPFQPTVQPGPDASMAGAMPPYPPRMGPKGRRMPGMGGPNGFAGKRSNGERPACTFFAGGRCRFGDECHFPHILPDGTDARPLQAQQRQMFAAQYGGGNAAMRSAGRANGVPASAPTGPQAEKKAAAEKQQQQQGLQEADPSAQSHEQQATNAKTTSPSASPVTANGMGAGAASVVRSNPSKTSTQAAAAAASRGQQGGSAPMGKKQGTQPAQRIPTVNDFPALAVSPNLSGPTATSPRSPSLQIQTPVVASTGAEASTASAPTAAPLSANGSAGLARANFSAILSAPAPSKPKTVAETAPGKGTGAEDEESKEEQAERSTGEDRSGKTQGKTSVPVKDVKGRGKEAKTSKADSYKGAASTKASSTADDDDDFQLVHRSRPSNKRNNGSSSDGFAAQAKAVAA